MNVQATFCVEVNYTVPEDATHMQMIMHGFQNLTSMYSIAPEDITGVEIRTPAESKFFDFLEKKGE